MSNEPNNDGALEDTALDQVAGGHHHHGDGGFLAGALVGGLVGGLANAITQPQSPNLVIAPQPYEPYPPPQPVYVQPPQPVYEAPPQPVYVQPAQPVYQMQPGYPPQPVYAAPQPVYNSGW